MMPQESEQHRILWIDSLKGIGIFLVIVGHFSGQSRPLHQYIYSFHLPLFFFASGFISVIRPGEGFGQFLKKRLPTRLLPYVFFYFISYVLFINGVATAIGMDIGTIIAVDRLQPYVIQPIIGLVLVQGEWLSRINNGTLWFLPCLLVTESLYFLLRQGMASMQRRDLVLPATVIVSAAAFFLMRGAYPWNLNIAIVSLVFYGLGNAVRHGGYIESIPLPTGIFGRAVMLAGLALLSLAATFYPFREGTHSLLAYLVYVMRAAAGISVSIAVAGLLIDYLPLRYFGRHSLVLLGTHLQIMTLAIAVINLTASLFTDKTIALNDDILAVLVALVTLILSIPCIEGLRLLASIASSKFRFEGAVTR